jgi:cobalt-zinc-cadmium efflux system outer membrane protein
MRPFSRRAACRLAAACALLIVTLETPLQAEETPLCPALQSPQDVLECVKLHDPALLRAIAERQIKTSAVRTAATRPNPEIESRVLFGTGESDGQILSETNFFHPFEVGGKRGARIQKARAGEESADRAVRVGADEVVIETVLGLHRLRQIATERARLDEVLSTYRRIVGLYRSRPLLSPEQETSLLVFESAREEGNLKKTSLVDEENRLATAFRLSLGTEIALSNRLLPASPRNWPEKPLEGFATGGWAPLDLARSELKNAQASGRLAKSEAWPTLQFGPSLETDSPLGDHQTSVGFVFSTALPIYDRKQGKKAEAKREEDLARLNLELKEREARAETARWVREYQNNLKAFQKAHAGFAFHKRHEELEARFERGLISSVMLLEAHREMLHLQQEIHRTELKALEALWRIYALEGRILEEKI